MIHPDPSTDRENHKLLLEEFQRLSTDRPVAEIPFLDHDSFMPSPSFSTDDDPTTEHPPNDSNLPLDLPTSSTYISDLQVDHSGERVLNLPPLSAWVSSGPASSSATITSFSNFPSADSSPLIASTPHASVAAAAITAAMIVCSNRHALPYYDVDDDDDDDDDDDHHFPTAEDLALASNKRPRSPSPQPLGPSPPPSPSPPSAPRPQQSPDPEPLRKSSPPPCSSPFRSASPSPSSSPHPTSSTPSSRDDDDSVTQASLDNSGTPSSPCSTTASVKHSPQLSMSLTKSPKHPPVLAAAPPVLPAPETSAATKYADSCRQRRAEAMERFRRKKAVRCFGRRVRYQIRKRIATTRPRVNGRFARRSDMVTVKMETESPDK